MNNNYFCSILFFTLLNTCVYCSVCKIKTTTILTPSIDWQLGDWAFACDFNNNDLSNVQTAGADCGPTCVNNPLCTHFTWTNHNGGTCWLKTGDISKSDALYNGDNTMVCGVVRTSPIIIPPSIAWQFGDWAFACDFPNHDLINIQTRPENCGPKCKENPKCTHFTWTTFNGGTCWMKTGTISKDNALYNGDYTMVCGVVRTEVSIPSIDWQFGDWALGCDFENKNLINVQTPAYNCGPTCLNNPQCTHFTWTTLNGGTCKLKYGNIDKSDAFKTDDNSMVCGVARTTASNTQGFIDWQVGDWAMGCDFVGNNLISVQAPGYKCGSICSQYPKCTHFTWTTYIGGTCILKYGDITKNDAYRTNDYSMVCGVVNKPPSDSSQSIDWQIGNWAFACDFIGNELTNIQTKPENCGPTCVNTPKCTHFTWTTYNGGTCWLKSGKITQNDAYKTNDYSMVCGFINSN